MLIAIASIKKRKKRKNKNHAGQKTFPAYISHHEGNGSNCQIG